jgi:hypothetical protein
MRHQANRLASSLIAALLVGCGCAKRKGENEEGPSLGAPHERYGELMSEVGRRFEFLGRAAAARRWELAAFELEELEEIFAELPAAEPPGHMDEISLDNLSGIEEAFRNTHPPELSAALAGRDSAAVAAAFASTAATCNSCHRATGHAFIEIPAALGAGVPKLDRVP